MARNTARLGRRRRVLNEEVLTAVSSAREELTCAPGDTPRYGAGANIENHPQVTDLVPRRYRVIALVIGLGLSVGLLAETAAHYSERLSAVVPAVSSTEISSIFADRLVSWASAAILLLSAGYARLIFSLRRHRVDDYRGRYRVWRTASLAAIALSLNTVVGCHTIVARVLGSLTRWSLLPDHAGWWLAAAAIVGGWLLLKLILDAAECRGALATYLLAIACFVIAGASAIGWSPVWAADWPDTMGRALPLAGYLLLLAGSLLFARYVVLDVQGLIEHRAVPSTPRLAERDASARQSPHSEQSPEEQAQLLEKKADDDAWVDGSDSQAGDPESGKRRLSKAERKRLRKQKNRNRAA